MVWKKCPSITCVLFILLAELICAPLTGLLLAETEPDLKPLPHASFRFEGPVGQRIQAGVDHWLLPAPDANPGMIQMFHVRDRQPVPKLVPWAGEFAGKYLISAIQALRITERPDLRARVTSLVADLIASQAEDGYLGPFPREIRLKSNWDLWGHYHCMLALLMWHEATGDAAALQCSRRAADLICQTFLNSKLRVFDAGSPEMNMAVAHSLGRLYRITADPHYLRMMHEIEKDWERTGDYLRTGLSGVEFFETPRPRWESLHDLQALVEFYRITSEQRYKTAFEHHWRSIARWDRRNTGGFSSGEQATGNPYAPTAIETCCTVAWMALSIDMLSLTRDSRVADELELSFFNAALGAQHPSGRWCTYNTPMDGVREASAHTIVFQSRAGTPELNCCSVNGPRGLGLLSEWAVMQAPDGLAVNYYGPGSFQGKLGDNTPVALKWTTGYPISESVLLRVEPLVARRFKLLLRIPAWSKTTAASLNGKQIAGVTSGEYLVLDRKWEPGDRISLSFDFSLRALPGDHEAFGRVSVYRGPLLLAYDQSLNAFDEEAIPAIDLSQLASAKELAVPSSKAQSSTEPWLVLSLPALDGYKVRVCDFASAGALGTRYRSWLPAKSVLPPPVIGRLPRDGGQLELGNPRFAWTGTERTNQVNSTYELRIRPVKAPFETTLVLSGLRSNEVSLNASQLSKLARGETYSWSVTSANENGKTENFGPSPQFTFHE